MNPQWPLRIEQPETYSSYEISQMATALEHYGYMNAPTALECAAMLRHMLRERESLLSQLSIAEGRKKGEAP